MQTADRPRFRQDLVAEPIEDDGARFIDVADPDSGQLFRFYEVEYSLACAMDGQRDVAGIVRWAEEELGLKPSPNEVRSVVATLGDLGFLERGVEAAAAVAAAAAAEPVVEAPRPAPHVEQPAAAPKPTPASRWEQQPPAASAEPEQVLERGVVAAPPRAATPVADFELGTPGGRMPMAREELPQAPELELGAPGVTAQTRVTARGAAAEAEIALGASGAGVSTDLAADMPIRPDDVKEAVRASQIMRSVDVPADLAAELEAPKPAAPKPAARPEPVPEPTPVRPEPRVEAAPGPQVEPRPEPTPPPRAEPAPRAESKPKPIEMPTERPVQPKAPPAPATGTSPLLIGLLVLVVLAAGGFIVYKYVLKKPEKKESTHVMPTVHPMKVEPPPPPPVETAKLALEQRAPEEIKPTAATQIATIVANDTAVKAGEPIARLVGFKPLEADVAAANKEIAKVQAEIDKATKARDAAQAAGNKAGIAGAEAKLAGLQKTLGEREAKLATKTAALDKYLIKAPVDGTVTAVAKANSKVTPNDIVATVAREPVLVATFKAAGESTQDSKVLLAVKSTDQKLSCTVVATGGDGTKIACPAGSASEGTEVTFAGLDTSAPATPESGAATPTEPPKTEAPKTEAPKTEAPKTEAPKTEAPKAEAPKAQKPAKATPPPQKPASAGTPPAGGEAEKPADKPVEKPVDKPVEKPVDKPAEPAAGSAATP